MIEKRVLEEYGAEIILYSKGDYIFKEGNFANYYFQIISGGVKMNYYNDKGNEFIQGVFGKDKGFGEPPLLIESKYPANAVSMNKSKIYRLKKETFKELLLAHSDIHYQLTTTLSQRLYFKATMANGITSKSAEQAILTLFDYLKNDVHENNISFDLHIDFTRKNIAGLLGLSVAATIRTIKQMETEGKLKIVNQKIYY